MNDTNLTTIYANSFRDNFNLPALTDYGDKASTITYGELAKRIARLHILFEAAGIKPGDKIAVMGRNRATWVTVFMATLTYGAVIVPILAEFSPTDAQHIINHSETRLLFVADSIFEHIEPESLPKVMAIISLDRRKLLYERDDNEAVIEKTLKNLTRKFKARFKKGFSAESINYLTRPADSLAVLNYTSGTTGFSKGVMLSLNNLAGNVVFGINSRLHYQG
ncbi:MAG: AMP-binding protein, partial [Muribaculaceae bacterium]|nr:AMP-binding protein [Muribaculaceae bacterium]